MLPATDDNDLNLFYHFVTQAHTMATHKTTTKTSRRTKRTREDTDEIQNVPPPPAVGDTLLPLPFLSPPESPTIEVGRRTMPDTVGGPLRVFMLDAFGVSHPVFILDANGVPRPVFTLR
jgi:hypothetical protein